MPNLRYNVDYWNLQLLKYQSMFLLLPVDYLANFVLPLFVEARNSFIL
jgi:hypothetical protein